MKVSMNELRASLKRCYEAAGYFVGNYEDAANMILWLEKQGLGGLEAFKDSLPYLKADRNKSASSVVYEDHMSATIDSHGRSALNCIASAVDLAQAKALESGIATITVHNCHNRIFVLKALTDCGRRGMSATAYWQNGGPVVTEHTAAIRAGARYPHYSSATTNLPADVQEQQSLTIVCSSRVDLSSSLQQSKGNQLVCEIGPDELSGNKAVTIEQGIEIEPGLWKVINKVGQEILVENSDQSRQGAG